MIKIAIVILNWNGKEYLKKFLPYVLKHSNKEDYFVYIADNGSNLGYYFTSIIFLTRETPFDSSL